MKAKEGEVEIEVSKKIFYNPAMTENRDISINLLNSIENKDMQIALPLAASGIRGVRMIKEVKKGKIKTIEFNDLDKKAVSLIKKNLKTNKIKSRFKINNKDANEFMILSKGFDYIDIDPFGSPNPFLDSAIKRIARGGILAVTATDTGCLSGTFPRACKRKYWAKPLLNELKHELGLRILIRKIQLIGAEHDKALIPIFSHSTLHYMRVYFICKKGKQEADKIIKQHKYFLYCSKCMKRRVGEFNIDVCHDSWMEYAGPLWTGQLWDIKLIQKMSKNMKSRLMNAVKEESKINVVGFFDLHVIAKKYKKEIPKTADLIKKIKQKNYKAGLTHFSDTGIRTDINIKDLIKLF
ncbi:tRNA (guanine(10)-N(2))-dimethyltransferase [Candidatus Woesearchaeota archaeon]|nr:tRNA (guanine(10)-N(2))-dimethyltransferase [Candidatus Woesearchaeota archaeon]